MLEKEIENLLVWHVERIKGRAYKFMSPSNRGVSDRIVCLPDGSTWFIELKRPKGGRLSPLQQIFAGEMQMLNQKYALLTSAQEINEWIKKL